MKKYIIISLLVLLVIPSIGQETKMRTRLLTSLTNVEIENYLKRNDIIFVPVGATEVHGAFPVDCEYVGPMALALKMAEEVDGLVLPHMAYFYPGATQVGRGTVHTSSIEGAEYLLTIARSLLRQGFKTQIYITGHAPSYGFMEPFLFDFLHETQVPVLYMNQITLMSEYGGGFEASSFNSMIYGAYSIVGRLDDIPLDFENFDIPEDYIPQGDPEAASKLLHLNNTQAVQWYFNSPYDHGGIPMSITAEERDQRAKEGVELIDNLIGAMDLHEIINNHREHQQFIDEMVKKYGDLLDFK